MSEAQRISFEELERILNFEEKMVRLEPDGTCVVWSPEDQKVELDRLSAQLAEAKGKVDIAHEELGKATKENLRLLYELAEARSRITRLEGAISSAILTLEGIQGICWPKVSGVVRILKAALSPEAEDVGKVHPLDVAAGLLESLRPDGAPTRQEKGD